MSLLCHLPCCLSPGGTATSDGGLTQARPARAPPRRRAAARGAAACVALAMLAGPVVAGGRPAVGPANAPAGTARATSDLPRPVQELVEALRAAVAAGDIEELREPLAWSELKPALGAGPVADPIAHWRRQSADGSGRETLALLDALLATPPLILPLGRDVENNRLYVWPDFAETPLDRLTTSQQAHVARLVAPSPVAAMLRANRYRGPRLVIGADGTWHRFGPDD